MTEFRFYAELNHFLAPSLRHRDSRHACPPNATVKHMIEALGVPHTEVELILADGVPVDFSHMLRDGERISVYPYFGRLEPGAATAPRPPLAGVCRFVADAHLGQLARDLRMLGFDVLYRNDYNDAEVARIASEDGRIVLSRDRDLLIRKEIVYGCYLHATAGEEQLEEVVIRYRLDVAARAFTRCLHCNRELRPADKDKVADRVPPQSWRVHDRFFECPGCAKVYWEGSHVARMRSRIERMRLPGEGGRTPV